MPKVKITTDRTWVAGKKAEINKEYDVSEEEAKILVANGFAVEIKKTARKTTKKV